MLSEFRDQLAEELEGDAKEFFLGLIEGIHGNNMDVWSERAVRAMYTPGDDLPVETLAALVKYLNRWLENHS